MPEEDLLCELDSLTAPTPNPKRIIILGGGLAGLAAAHELGKLGHDVVLYEAQHRVGGRVWTWRPGPGCVHEFGAMRIPAGHHLTRHYIAQTGLKDKLRPFRTSHANGEAFYLFNDDLVRIRCAAPVLRRNFALSAREQAIIAGGAPAPALLGAQLEWLVDELTAADKEALLGKRPLTPRIRQLAGQTLGDFLDANLDSAAARDLIGVSTGLDVWWDRSVAMFARDEIVGTGDGLEELDGGMDQLPTALAARIPNGVVQMGHAVVAMHRRGASVDIKVQRTKDQEGYPIDEKSPVETVCADHVLCTLPFGVLRGIDVQGLSDQKMRAIRRLTYASSVKVLFYVKDRIWERAPTSIFGGATHSDRITRATYYPSDSAAKEKVRPVLEVGRRGLHTTCEMNRVSSATGATTGEPRPGVLVASYSWGADALRMGALSKAERREACLQVLERVHPGLRDVVIEDASIAWHNYRWSRGAFGFHRPGDFEDIYPAAIAPDGPIHFAGEHASLEPGWMQGAFESAIRAVLALARESSVLCRARP